ncbi:MAG: hypothetical protein SFX19_02565 [Alphaproteobacteria bacterium]|nr:hypothetical protein [Alphaproteobacteria bacterium]
MADKLEKKPTPETLIAEFIGAQLDRKANQFRGMGPDDLFSDFLIDGHVDNQARHLRKIEHVGDDGTVTFPNGFAAQRPSVDSVLVSERGRSSILAFDRNRQIAAHLLRTHERLRDRTEGFFNQQQPGPDVDSVLPLLGEMPRIPLSSEIPGLTEKDRAYLEINRPNTSTDERETHAQQVAELRKKFDRDIGQLSKLLAGLPEKEMEEALHSITLAAGTDKPIIDPNPFMGKQYDRRETQALAAQVVALRDKQNPKPIEVAQAPPPTPEKPTVATAVETPPATGNANTIKIVLDGGEALTFTRAGETIAMENSDVNPGNPITLTFLGGIDETWAKLSDFAKNLNDPAKSELHQVARMVVDEILTEKDGVAYKIAGRLGAEHDKRKIDDILNIKAPEQTASVSPPPVKAAVVAEPPQPATESPAQTAQAAQSTLLESIAAAARLPFTLPVAVAQKMHDDARLLLGMAPKHMADNTLPQGRVTLGAVFPPKSDELSPT